MSESGAPAVAQARDAEGSWRVRRAEGGDAAAVAGAVASLLVELGASPPPHGDMLAAAQALLADAEAGVALLAQSGEGAIGVLTASLQLAVHVPGRYALIQDLWVERSWRGRAVGAALLEGLGEILRERGIALVEVGLPRASFAELAGTESFYLASGFEAVGQRMRWRLS